MYMSVERNISHEAGEVKEELCQEAKAEDTFCTEPDYP